MFKQLMLAAGLWVFALSAVADTTAQGFQRRFSLVKNDQQEVVAIRLRAITGFSIRPYLKQIKDDLLAEQRRLRQKGAAQHEQEVDAALQELGLDPYAKDVSEETLAVKEALLSIPAIAVEDSFHAVEQTGLFREFEAKLQEALLQLDLSVVANLSDARFFYRRNVAYQVVTWALEQAQKRFSSVPLLNLASFVIVKVHDLLHEQRTFHHNMLLHYFENLPEAQLGMTKDEVDRAVSSIYEYRLGVTDIRGSNEAARNWERFGWNKFYATVRQGNTRARNLGQDSSRYGQLEKANFAFARVTDDAGAKIYHLLQNQHLLSSKPALAYDFANPSKVQRTRSLLNLAQVGLGFVPGLPSFVKNLANTFIDSMHKEQRRLEGALVAHFELTGNPQMVDALYRQNVNPYLVR